MSSTKCLSVFEVRLPAYRKIADGFKALTFCSICTEIISKTVGTVKGLIVFGKTAIKKNPKCCLDWISLLVLSVIPGQVCHTPFITII